jgi:hypothetical protein
MYAPRTAPASSACCARRAWRCPRASGRGRRGATRWWSGARRARVPRPHALGDRDGAARRPGREPRPSEPAGRGRRGPRGGPSTARNERSPRPLRDGGSRASDVSGRGGGMRTRDPRVVSLTSRRAAPPRATGARGPAGATCVVSCRPRGTSPAAAAAASSVRLDPSPPADGAYPPLGGGAAAGAGEPSRAIRTGKLARRRACTPGLSTWWSTTALVARPRLEAGFPLRCLQRLSLPDLATRPRGWRHDRSTRGPSAPVLSY